MKCVVNVQGYARLTGFKGQEDVILPYVWKNNEDVHIVNNYGNVIEVCIENIQIL